MKIKVRNDRSWIELSQGNLLRNLTQIRSVVGKSKNICCVVKANAYGHGLEEIVKLLDKESNCDTFAVDSLNEAAQIRKLGITKKILVLGYTHPQNYKYASSENISLTVYSYEEIKKIKSHRFPQKLNLHIKVETGLNRQGLHKDDVLRLAKLINLSDNLNLEGISTHFADVEDTLDSSFSKSQLKSFKETLNLLKSKNIKPKMVHTAASAATILYKNTHFNTVRLGIALYGLWPSKETKISVNVHKINGVKVALKPVLSWKSPIAQIKHINAGESVGYGRTWFSSAKTKIAIVPVGYSDGYPRSLGNRSSVIIGGQYAPIIGRVAMNMIVVDATNIKNINKQSVVTLIGSDFQKNITADQLAQKSSTINYEIVSRINPSLERKVIK